MLITDHQDVDWMKPSILWKDINSQAKRVWFRQYQHTHSVVTHLSQYPKSHRSTRHRQRPSSQKPRLDSRKQLFLTTLDQRFGSNLQALANIVCPLGNETKLFETPNCILSNANAQSRHPEDRENWKGVKRSCEM